MSFTSISQCAKSLDFEPRQSWPHALPAMSWKGLLLCGFERIGGGVVDLFSTQNVSLKEALIACHPKLGLGEISRLSQKLAAHDQALFDQTMEGLLHHYQLRWNDRLKVTLDKLVLTPKEFQHWVDDKSVAARDLAPLLAVDKIDSLNDFIIALTRLPISKSEGILALELAVDLFLMGTPINDLMPTDSKPALWLEKLQVLRKPEAAQKDLEMREKVSRLAWPANVQAQWVRQGDESGIEIKLRVKTPQDLGAKLEKLSSVGEAWQFWKN